MNLPNNGDFIFYSRLDIKVVTFYYYMINMSIIKLIIKNNFLYFIQIPNQFKLKIVSKF